MDRRTEGNAALNVVWFPGWTEVQTRALRMFTGVISDTIELAVEKKKGIRSWEALLIQSCKKGIL